jgi:RNA recognition motif-containing protein
MQGNKLYVGNLASTVTEEDLKELFSQCGEVKEAKVVEGKNFGFVEMSTQLEAQKARQDLDGKDLKGFKIRVQPAQPPKKQNRSRGYGQRRY